MATKKRSRKPKKLERRRGKAYSQIIVCVDCGTGRFVKPQDIHLAKRCKVCQRIRTLRIRAAAARKRRAKSK